jgi:transketolase
MGLLETDVSGLARNIRTHALRMTHRSRASHIGGCLSIADMLAVLYGRVLRVDPSNPEWPDRDRLILSKGHSAAALYAVLAEKGLFPRSWLDHYCEDGSSLIGHVSHHVPGVEVSTGSLGHGLSIACGMALAAKRDGIKARTFVILSDGELDEGSNWEAILFAAHHKLGHLCAIVDYNKIQSFGAVKDVINLDPLADKWRVFGWGVKEIDGHDLAAIENALRQTPFDAGRPSAVIAHTVKGKGISFMEGRLEWHYKSPNDEQLAQALRELELAG